MGFCLSKYFNWFQSRKILQYIITAPQVCICLMDKDESGRYRSIVLDNQRAKPPAFLNIPLKVIPHVLLCIECCQPMAVCLHDVNSGFIQFFLRGKCQKMDSYKKKDFFSIIQKMILKRSCCECFYFRKTKKRRTTLRL